MTTDFQSFARSPMGGFIRSPLDVRRGEAFYGPWAAITSNLGSNSIILLSADGHTWAEYPKAFPAPAPAIYPWFPTYVFGDHFYGLGNNGVSVCLYRSYDLTGRGWTNIGLTSASDHHMLQLVSGRLLYTIGYDAGYRDFAYSDDDGATWSYVDVPVDPVTGVGRRVGQIKVLASGRIVSGGTNDSNFTPDSQCRALSYYSDDNGSTWNYAIVDNTTDGFGNPWARNAGTLIYDGVTLFLICVSSDFMVPPNSPRLYSSTNGVDWAFVQTIAGIHPPGTHLSSAFGESFYLSSFGRHIVADLAYSIGGIDPRSNQDSWITDDNGKTWIKIASAPLGLSGSLYYPMRKVGSYLYQNADIDNQTILRRSLNGIDWFNHAILGNYGDNSCGLAIRGALYQ
ncbi:MAG: sialidase family protein [Candidatus Nanopelagicaceae bacterium]|nr:sialidase family protein [Candidatus Nanopelagicaceae bacterium]